MASSPLTTSVVATAALAQPLEKSVASIRWLAAPTNAAWVAQATARPIEILIDHAHASAKRLELPCS